MRSYGTGGQTVTQINQAPFTGFTTCSGRDIVADLERARRRVVSPIRLAPKVRTPRPAPLPSPLHTRIVTAFHAGTTSRLDLAAALGVSWMTVDRHLRAEGLTPADDRGKR